jgi:hypothetical protein
MQAPVESKLGARPAQHIVNRDSWTAADHSQRRQPFSESGSRHSPATIRRRSSLKKVRFRRRRRLKLVSLAEPPPGLRSFSSPSSSYYSSKSTAKSEAQLRRRQIIAKQKLAQNLMPSTINAQTKARCLLSRPILRSPLAVRRRACANGSTAGEDGEGC